MAGVLPSASATGSITVLTRDPRVLGLFQRLLEGDRARAPGAEMLGGEVAAARFLDIVVDVAGGDRLAARRRR